MPYVSHRHGRLPEYPHAGTVRALDWRKPCLSPSCAPTAPMIPRAGPGRSADRRSGGRTKKAIELRYEPDPLSLHLRPSRRPRRVPQLCGPCFCEFQSRIRRSTFNLRDEWLDGEIACSPPRCWPKGECEVSDLPAGQWYDFNTGAPVPGGQTLSRQVPLDVIPAYVRAGTIHLWGLSCAVRRPSPGRPAGSARLPWCERGAFSLYEDGKADNYDYLTGKSSDNPVLLGRHRGGVWHSRPPDRRVSRDR